MDVPRERCKVSRSRTTVVDGTVWSSRGFATSRSLNATSCLSSSWIQRLIPFCPFSAQDAASLPDSKYTHGDYKPVSVYENSRTSKHDFYGSSQSVPSATGAMNAVLEAALAPPAEHAVRVLPKSLPTVPSLQPECSEKMEYRRRALKNTVNVCSTLAGCRGFSNHVRQTVHFSDKRRPMVSCSSIEGLIPNTSAPVTGFWGGNPAITFKGPIVPADLAYNGPSASMNRRREKVDFLESMVMGDLSGRQSRQPLTSAENNLLKENLVESGTEQFSFHPFHASHLYHEASDSEHQRRGPSGERAFSNVMQNNKGDNNHYEGHSTGNPDCQVEMEIRPGAMLAYAHPFGMPDGGYCPSIQGVQLDQLHAQSANETVEGYQDHQQHEISPSISFQFGKCDKRDHQELMCSTSRTSCIPSLGRENMLGSMSQHSNPPSVMNQKRASVRCADSQSSFEKDPRGNVVCPKDTKLNSAATARIGSHNDWMGHKSLFGGKTSDQNFRCPRYLQCHGKAIRGSSIYHLDTSSEGMQPTLEEDLIARLTNTVEDVPSSVIGKRPWEEHDRQIADLLPDATCEDRSVVRSRIWIGRWFTDPLMQKARAPSGVGRERSFSAIVLPSCHIGRGDVSSKLGIDRLVKRARHDNQPILQHASCAVGARPTHKTESCSEFMKRFFTPSAAAMAVMGSTARQVHNSKKKGLFGSWASPKASMMRSTMSKAETLYKDAMVMSKAREGFREGAPQTDL